MVEKDSRNIVGEISTCVDSTCEGWLVDSFLGKYWIRCKDPRHIENKNSGSKGDKTIEPGKIPDTTTGDIYAIQRRSRT